MTDTLVLIDGHALVLWTDPIDSDTFQDTLARNREALTRRLGPV